MRDYLAAEGLSFGMASSQRYRTALTMAGFVDVQATSRNAWYREHAAMELERLRYQGVALRRAVNSPRFSPFLLL